MYVLGAAVHQRVVPGPVVMYIYIYIYIYMYISIYLYICGSISALYIRSSQGLLRSKAGHHTCTQVKHAILLAGMRVAEVKQKAQH